MDAVMATKVSHERVVADARRYQPFIHQILLSCKVQPEMARLDGKYATYNIVCFLLANQKHFFHSHQELYYYST
jgi:hypothetical protein